MLLEYAIQYKTRYARLLEINGLPDAPLAQDQFIYIEKGMRVTQIIAHDPSTPAAVVAANTPIAAPPVYRPAEKTSVPAPEAAPVEIPAPAATAARPVEQTPVAQPVSPAASHESLSVGNASASAQADDAKPLNIADEVAVEEEIDEAAKSAPATAKAPVNEFDRMKARFDQVVYTQPAKSAAPVAVARPVQAAPVVAPQATMSTGATHHTVKSGETAFGIARQYGITMKQLMAMNDLNFEAIKVGQKLRVK